MKKIFKIFTTVLIILAISVSVFAVPTFAASNTVIGFSKNQVTVGDTVTVSVTASVNSMYSTDISVSYDESVLTYVSGASSGGAGLVQIVEALSGENKKTFTLTFKAKKAGSCTISASGSVGAGVPADDVGLSGAAATMTVKDVTLSSNANLKSLSVSAGSLSPRFSKSTTSYTVNVKKTVTDCKIYATTADEDAKVSVSGSSTLKIGANKRVITVTAPSGTQKQYTVTINRSDVDEPTESSSTSSTSSEPEEENPLETIIDGVSYQVVADISKASLPTGFNVGKKLYNGEDVSVAVDEEKNYEIYYLKTATGNELVPYTYDEEANAFEKVQIITQGENKYIVAEIPEDYTVPSSYYSTNGTIGDINTKCYVSTSAELADMYYVYCFFNGKYGMYRYDTVEEVLQRSPEFNLVTAGSDAVDAVTSGEEGNGFADRFASLSTNAKTIVVCLAVAFLGVIVLIVLLIVKFTKGRSYEDFDEEEDDDDFDNIKFNDNFEIISDEEEEDKE